MGNEISRRGFLRRTGMYVGTAGISGLLASCSKPSSNQTQASKSVSAPVSPSNRLTLGFIGTGDHGVNVNLKNFLCQTDAQVVALCDVDLERLKGAEGTVARTYGANRPAGTYKGVFASQDWREIIARPDIDAVVISTPDHWHCLIAMAAMRAGKHVFCEKPLSLTIREGRIIADAAARYGVTFQVGTPNRSRKGFLKACELVRNGHIGKLHTIRVNIYRGHGPDGVNLYPDCSPKPVPPTFDYDMWLGQAPYVPYTPARCHFCFRFNLDYSGGNLADFGAHLLDVAQWGNNTEYTGPVSVEGKGVFPKHDLYNVATDWELTYRYANGVNLICKSGGYSVRFEGSDGWVEAAGVEVWSDPPALAALEIKPEETHLRTCALGEQRDFLDCVRTGQQPYAPPEIEHRSISLAHMGNIALQLGRKLEWDPAAERFVNDDSANRMLSRSMRAPWVL